MDSSIFKAYDIRGIYPDQISAADFKRIAQAYAAFVKPKTVAVGRDVRTSGPELQKAVIDGLLEAGVDVVDIGPVPTDGLYFAVGYYNYDGGIQVSASHNPAEYNGLKMIRGGCEAISADTGILDIKQIAESDEDLSSDSRGQLQAKDVTEDYLDVLAGFAEFETIPELKVVANNNFGLTGPLAESFLKRVGMDDVVRLVKLNFEPNGAFPKGRPDPLQPENRAETGELVRAEKADFGVAWDADGDRCFFFDENGDFVESSHFGAVQIERFLQKHPGEKIIYDIRNTYAAQQTALKNGGVAVRSKVGHAFIKDKMRQENALFAGELSGHYFFRDFYFADNGIIAFVIMLNLLADNPGKSLSAILEPWRQQYPVSGEVNFTVKDTELIMNQLARTYSDGQQENFDGLSVEYPSWRFSVRSSNTEPLIRLNVEGRSQALCDEKLVELAEAIKVIG